MKYANWDKEKVTIVELLVDQSRQKDETNRLTSVVYSLSSSKQSKLSSVPDFTDTLLELRRLFLAVDDVTTGATGDSELLFHVTLIGGTCSP